MDLRSFTFSGYVLSRAAFQRGLALVYLIAFLVALNQFRPLLGEKGLLPAPAYLQRVSFWNSPSLFRFFPTDTAFAAFAWFGIAGSCFALLGFSERFGTWVSILTWAALWVAYLSFVNAGQIFYAFGWESILLEAGFFAIFLGAKDIAVPKISLWMLRWLLFRVMFGAGLIKLRGDPCWRDFTCLDVYYETQPIPNPLSWYFHWAPQWTHRAGVGFNHFAELIVPFGYFLPQPAASIAGILTIVFQGLIMASGNLSWLNFLTMVLALTTLDDRLLAPVFSLFHPLRHAVLQDPPFYLKAVIAGMGLWIAWLSIGPIRNMISPRQVMNQSYNPLHLAGSYGAFGSITRPRYEVIVEGTDEAVLTPSTKWRAYEFKGKPGDPSRRPPQIAPYHLRLDWLMWFAALSDFRQEPWFVHFLAQLLKGDPATLSLLRANPFPDAPPRFIRAELYEYHFTTPAERKQTGRWWDRQRVDTYFPAVSLQNRALQDYLHGMGWQ